MSAVPLHRFLAPRHWPVWLGLGVVRLVAALPYRLQMGLGRVLGGLLPRLSARRRHIAATNLRIAFPELGEAERERLLAAHFRSLGMGMVETAMAWWSSDRQLAPLARVEGLEHLQAALARGHGVLLLSAHFTSLEIGGRLLSLHAPFHVTYRRHETPLFEEVMRRARERNFERAIPREDVRGFIRSLKGGHAVWYAPDQNYGHKHSVFAPFFGTVCATNTGTSRLAKLSAAPVVPYFPRRLADGSGYVLHILPPLAGFPSGDPVADAARINGLIEAEVRLAPEQYLWIHRRYKDRPEGEAGFY